MGEIRERVQNMLEDYRELGSYAAVAEKHNISRARVGQLLGGHIDEIAAEAEEERARAVIEAYRRLGSYKAVAEELGIGVNTIGRILNEYVPDEVGGVSVPERRHFLPTRRQWALIDSLGQQASDYIREGLDELLRDPDARDIIKKHINYPASATGDSKANRVKSIWITTEQAEAIEALSEELGHGTTSATFRAAIDYKRGNDAEDRAAR
jgi:transposase-like protein